MSEAPTATSTSAAPTGTALPPPISSIPGGPLPPGMPPMATLPPGMMPPPPGYAILPSGMPLPPGWAHVPGRPGWIGPIVARPAPPSYRYWPWSRGAATMAVLSAVGVAALVGAVALVLNRPGLGWLLSGVALATVGLVAALRLGEPATDDPPPDAPAQGTSAPAAATPSPAAAAPEVPGEVEDSGDTGDAAAGVAAADSATDALTAETLTADTLTADGVEPAAEPQATSAAEPTDSETAEPAESEPEGSGVVARGGLVGFTKRYGERVFWAAITLALLSVGTFRAAGWLYFWCVVFAIGTAAFGLAGGRTLKAMALGVIFGIAAPLMSIPWLGRGWTRTRRARRTGPRVLIVALISVVLVLVFGALFVGADAEFSHLVTSILPRLNGAEVARAVFCFVLIGLIGGGVAHLAAKRPTLDSMAPTRWRSVRRFEWVVPLLVLNVLFAVFDGVQLAVFFNPDRSLVTRSHAYLRGYAHEGFWQLLAVTILTLTVLGVTARIAPRDERADRVWLRVLLGGMAVFSLVIVAAALKRLSTYEAVFGFTTLRVVAGGIALWMGVVFVFVLVASMMLRAGWLPRVIAGSLAVALFAGAVADPDLYIAQHNIDRYHRIGKLSLSYMSTLSADAAPAMAALTPEQRQCAGWRIVMDLRDNSDDWRTYNAARERARQVLAGVTPFDPDRSCDIR